MNAREGQPATITARAPNTPLGKEENVRCTVARNPITEGGGRFRPPVPAMVANRDYEGFLIEFEDGNQEWVYPDYGDMMEAGEVPYRPFG